MSRTCDVLHKMDVVGRRNGEEAEAAVPPDAPFAAAETVLKFTPDNENVYHVQRLTREMASAPSSPVRQLTCHLPESSWQSLDDDEFECGTAHNSRSVFLVVKIAVDGNIEMVGGHHALACARFRLGTTSMERDFDLSLPSDVDGDRVLAVDHIWFKPELVKQREQKWLLNALKTAALELRLSASATHAVLQLAPGTPLARDARRLAATPRASNDCYRHTFSELWLVPLSRTGPRSVGTISTASRSTSMLPKEPRSPVVWLPNTPMTPGFTTEAEDSKHLRSRATTSTAFSTPASTTRENDAFLRPSWWHPFSDAPNVLAQAARMAGKYTDERCVTWLDDRGAEQKVLTFGYLWRRAGVLANLLLGSWGRGRGERVLLCFAPGPEFFVMFWACLRAGVIAVPVYPPDPAKLQKAIDKLALVRASCGATLCLCDSSVMLLKRTKGLFQRWPAELEWRDVEGVGESGAPDGPIPLDQASSGDLAFLQFTSGSTGDPKGVMISHANIWANINDVMLPSWERGFELKGLAPGTRKTGCSWLPQYVAPCPPRGHRSHTVRAT